MTLHACRVTALTAVALLAGTTPVHAQGIGGLLPTADAAPTRLGTHGASFLHLPVGARANAMAGAVGTSISGSTAWFWNPAGAATIGSFALSAGRQDLYGDFGLTQAYAAVSYPVFGGAIGVAVNSLNSGDIPVTDEATPLGDVVRGTSYQWTSTAISLGFARRLSDRLDAGASVKFISDGLPQARNEWLAADIGMQFRTRAYGLVLAGSLAHVGAGSAMDGTMLERGVTADLATRAETRVRLFTRSVELPTAFRFSVGEDLLGREESLLGPGSGAHAVYGELTLDDAVDMAVQTGIGVEYGYKRTLFVRGGKRFHNDGRAATGHGGIGFGMSGGFGFRVALGGRVFRFDYSYTSAGDLNDIQVFAIDISDQ